MTSPQAVIATVLDRIERRGRDHVWIWRFPAGAAALRPGALLGAAPAPAPATLPAPADAGTAAHRNEVRT